MLNTVYEAPGAGQGETPRKVCENQEVRARVGLMRQEEAKGDEPLSPGSEVTDEEHRYICFRKAAAPEQVLLCFPS